MNDSTIKAKTLTKGKYFFLYFLTLKFKSIVKVKVGKDETLIVCATLFSPLTLFSSVSAALRRSLIAGTAKDKRRHSQQTQITELHLWC